MNSHYRKRLRNYSVLAGSLLTASASTGAVIYTDIDPDEQLFYNNVTQFDALDLNGDGVDDLTFSGYYTFQTTFNSILSAYSTFLKSSIGVYGNTAGNGFVYTPGSAYPAALDEGQTVGPSAAFISSGLLADYEVQLYGSFFYSYDRGNFRVVDSKALSVRFDIAGNTHYGWVSVKYSLGSLTLIDYAYEDLPNTAITVGDVGSPSCSTDNPPQNPRHTANPSNFLLEWDPVAQSVACQVQGTRLTPPGPSPRVNLIGLEPSSTNVPYSALGAGTQWIWKARCACLISPSIEATAFSAEDTLNVPALREKDVPTELSTFPNPASNVSMLNTTLELDRDTEVRIIDLSGRVVDFIILPQSTRQLNIDVADLDNGLYFVQVGDMEAVTLEVVH